MEEEEEEEDMRGEGGRGHGSPKISVEMANSPFVSGQTSRVEIMPLPFKSNL